MRNSSIVLPTVLLSLKNFLVFSILFYLPLHFSDMGFSGLEIGVLLSTFAITSFASSFLAGLLSDRFPVRYLSSISFFLLMIYLISFSLTENFWIILASFFVGGLGNNIADISLTSFVLKVTEKKDSGKRLGVFTTVKTLASGLGALTGGLMLAHLAFKNVFMVLAFIFFITIVFTLLVRKIGTFRYSLEHYRGDLWKKEVFFFTLLIFVFTMHWGAEGTSYSLLLKENFGLDQNSLALYIGTIWLFFGMFIYYISRKIQDTTTLKRIIYPGIVLSGAGHILFVIPSLPVSYLFRLVHEFGDAAFEMFLLVGIHRYFPTERIGGTSGVVLTVTIAGRLVGSLVFGPMGDLWGYQYPFIISGILTLTCLLIVKQCEW